MTVWQPSDVARFAYNAGFSGNDVVTATAICFAESSGDDHAINTNLDGSIDRGLWQINNVYHSEVSESAAFDPQMCADAAFEIAHTGAGAISFQPWSSYNSGRYQKYTTLATNAAAPYTGANPPPRNPNQTTAVRPDNKPVPPRLSGPLGDLPLIITDAPVTDDPNQTRFVGDQSQVYGITTIVTVPNGYATASLRRGLSFMYGRDAYSGEMTQAVMIHGPSGKLEDFRHGWQQLPNLGHGGSSIVFGGTTYGLAAAQRHGEWIYYFTRYSDYDNEYSSISKSSQLEFSQVVYNGNFTLTYGQAPILPQVTDAFVSDTNPVQMWIKGGFSGVTSTEVTWVVDNHTQFGTRFDSTPFSGDYGESPGSGIIYTGKLGQGLQRYADPQGVICSPYGASLVHPWSAGDYGPPELWWFVAEKKGLTGRIKIYRSRFYRNQWQQMNPGQPWPHDHRPYNGPGASHSTAPVGITVNADATGENNPHGNAFERKFHYVGTVGPFPNLPPLGNGQISGSWPHIKVLRSRKNRGLLYFVAMGDSADMQAARGYYGDMAIDFFDGAWFATSHDDGATWNSAKQMSPAHGSGAGTLESRYSSQLGGFRDCAITHDDFLVMNVFYADSRTDQVGHGYINPYNPQSNNKNVQYAQYLSRASLVVINYDPRGIAGKVDRRQHIFKQGEKVRDSWL